MERDAESLCPSPAPEGYFRLEERCERELEDLFREWDELEDLFRECDRPPELEDLRREELDLLGTFAPDRRASDRPIAIACLRLVTFLPERPLFN